MRKTILPLLLLFCALQSAGQEEFVAPPSRLLTRIPFYQLTGGVIILRACLDNFKDTLNFILDSGSSGISLDSTTVEELKLKPVPSSIMIRGIAGIKNVSFLYNRQLHLPNLTIDSLNFHVNDYSILTSVYGERVDGIIGYSVLSRYIVKINYDSLKIEFCTRGSIRYPKGGFLLKPFITTVAIESARVRDEATVSPRFLHDIGAGVCLMLSKDFIEDSALLKKKRKLYPKQGEGVGGKIDMFETVIKEFKLGPYRFRDVPTYIFNDVYNITNYPYLGGLIGNDILRRFNTIINYEKRDIFLIPNSHYDETFDYSYSGIELYLIDGNIEVGDVAKDSPAAEAGLQEGDIVMGINNNLTGSLNQYKVLLQAANEKISMLIRRNGELRKIEFRIKSII